MNRLSLQKLSIVPLIHQFMKYSNNYEIELDLPLEFCITTTLS